MCTQPCPNLENKQHEHCMWRSLKSIRTIRIRLNLGMYLLYGFDPSKIKPTSLSSFAVTNHSYIFSMFLLTWYLPTFSHCCSRIELITGLTLSAVGSDFCRLLVVAFLQLVRSISFITISAWNCITWALVLVSIDGRTAAEWLLIPLFVPSWLVLVDSSKCRMCFLG